MSVSIISPNPLSLPSGFPVRTPPRPWKQIDLDYVQQFDWATVAYDVAYDGDEFELTCPPLRNLRRQLPSILAMNGITVGSRVRTHKMDRSQLVRFHAEDHSGLERRFTSPSSTNRLLAGRNVLMTMSKDNDLTWIADWIEFHATVHGVTSVLLYDNDSSLYDPADIGSVAAAVPGVEEVVIVRWPFRYGPQGTDGRRWDSDFCQAGALNHARRNFLRLAESVLSIDIDELVVSDSGDSILRSLLDSRFAAYSFTGRWISSERPPGSPMAHEGGTEPRITPRHRDFDALEQGTVRCPPKWAAVPNRLGSRSYFSTHGVKRCSSTRSADFEYRHFRPISTGWKYPRNGDEGTYSSARRDPVLREHFDVVWPT